LGPLRGTLIQLKGKIAAALLIFWHQKARDITRLIKESLVVMMELAERKLCYNKRLFRHAKYIFFM